MNEIRVGPAERQKRGWLLLIKLCVAGKEEVVLYVWQYVVTGRVGEHYKERELAEAQQQVTENKDLLQATIGSMLYRLTKEDIVENRKPKHSVQPFKPSLIGIFLNNVPMWVQDCTINKPRRGRRDKSNGVER